MAVWPGDKPPDRIGPMDENDLRDELRATLVDLARMAEDATALQYKLHHYQYRLGRVIGWRENDWPEWFDRRTAEAVAELATPEPLPEAPK